MEDGNKTDDIEGHNHQVPVFMAYMVVWVISITGNSLVCVVVRRSRRVQSTTNFFVIAISVTDLTYCIVALPNIGGSLLVGRWAFGDILCRIVRLVQYASPGVLLYVLLCISIDRYYTIIYPLSFKIKRGTAKRMIAVCWVISYIISIFCLFFFKESSKDDRPYCQSVVDFDNHIGIFFTVANVLLQYILPIVFMVFLYVKVWKYIWRVGDGCRISRTQNHVSRTKVNMVKMLITITSTTVIFFAPYYISLLWYGISRPASQPDSLLYACIWFVFFAGMTRPFLYMCFNSNFRRGCKEVVCLSHSRCYRGHNYAITHASRLHKNNHVGVLPNSPMVDSPSKVFDRTVADQSQWPFQNNNMPASSYL